VIYIPVNEKGIPVDETGQKIDSNTIIECAFDVENYRWIVKCNYCPSINRTISP
jgi:hypothetical protein